MWCAVTLYHPGHCRSESSGFKYISPQLYFICESEAGLEFYTKILHGQNTAVFLKTYVGDYQVMSNCASVHCNRNSWNYLQNLAIQA